MGQIRRLGKAIKNRRGLPRPRQIRVVASSTDIKNGINFIPKEATDITYLLPEFVREVNFMHDGEQYIFVSSLNDVKFKTKKSFFLKPRYQFYRIIEKGKKLTILAKYYRNNNSQFEETTIATYMYFKTVLFEPRRRNWKADMLSYFHDCPLLKQKIKDKRYKKDDAREIAIVYN